MAKGLFMAVSVQGTKTENSGGISPAKSMPKSRKAKKPMRMADGDSIVRVVVQELMDMGYSLELVNYEDDQGDMTAAILLTGKTWTQNGELIRKVEK